MSFFGLMKVSTHKAVVEAHETSVAEYEEALKEGYNYRADLRRRLNMADAKALSYEEAHDVASAMGYPSLTEALEDLDRLRTREARRMAGREKATQVSAERRRAARESVS